MKDFAYLCLDRDIPEGEYRTFALFGEDLVAKKESGVITVAINRCEHRGFKPMNGQGRLESCTFKCPYHGQKFNFKRKLETWNVGQMIFVGPTEFGSTSAFGAIASRLGEEFATHVQDVKAPFYLWIENTADPNHLRFVHKSFHSVFESQTPHSVEIDRSFSSYCMNVKKEVVGRYVACMKQNVTRFMPTEFYHAIVFPHLSVTSFLGVFFSVETAMPTPEGTQVTTRFFVAKDIVVPEVLKITARHANITILTEDKAIVEEWAKSYDRHDYDDFLPGEERIVAYFNQIISRGYYASRGYTPLRKRSYCEHQ